MSTLTAKNTRLIYDPANYRAQGGLVIDKDVLADFDHDSIWFECDGGEGFRLGFNQGDTVYEIYCSGHVCFAYDAFRVLKERARNDQLHSV
jgi:hypothetical protein